METSLHTAEAFLNASSLARTFAELLGKQIVEGRLAPGDRLIETRLAEQFGISRSPVREGLRILSHEGLVILVERRGAIVKPITARDVEEAFSCRMVLQGLAARLAAERWRGAAPATLHHLLDQMEQAEHHGRVDEYFAANLEFHEFVRMLSGNARLRRLLGTLGNEMLRLRFLTSSLEGRLPQSITLHRQIIEALEARDGERAERITRELIWSGCQMLLEQIRKT